MNIQPVTRPERYVIQYNDSGVQGRSITLLQTVKDIDSGQVYGTPTVLGPYDPADPAVLAAGFTEQSILGQVTADAIAQRDAAQASALSAQAEAEDQRNRAESAEYTVTQLNARIAELESILADAGIPSSGAQAPTTDESAQAPAASDA